MRTGLHGLTRDGCPSERLWRLGLLVSVLVAAGTVAQFGHIVLDQWHHRTYVIPYYAEDGYSLPNVVLLGLPWLPGFLGRWLPSLLTYVSVVVAVIALGGRPATRVGSSLRITPVGPERLLIALIFAAGAVGYYSSYRGVQIPVLLLLSVGVMRTIGYRSGRTEHLLQLSYSGPLETIADYEQLRTMHLKRSRSSTILAKRNDDLQRRVEKAQIGAAKYVAEIVFTPLLRRFVDDRAITGEKRTLIDVDYMTSQELALSLGPQVHWWRNGVYAAKVGVLLATPAVAYNLYQTSLAGSFSSAWLSRSGVFDVLGIVLAQLLVWFTLAFALGALWAVLPARRGFYKGLQVGLVLLGAQAIDTLIAMWLGQAITTDYVSWSTLVLAFLATLGVVLDVATMKTIERERWEFINYLKLRDTRWVATYGATAILLVSTVFHQVVAGETLGSVTTSIGQVVTGNDITKPTEKSETQDR